MGKLTGFREYKRKDLIKRPIEERIQDYEPIYLPPTDEQVKEQAARCMDCGVPFCNSFAGCPLGNTIPELNDLVYKGQWQKALDILQMTNNFPEFTGEVCPHPCESACILGMDREPVAIKQIEKFVVEKGFEEGWIVPRQPARRTGKQVAVIGSGPSGLACADQLNQAGHSVTVFEREDSFGGLLNYGIPDFKLSKKIVARRIQLLTQEGITFLNQTWVGRDYPAVHLTQNFDSIVLCGGTTVARDLTVPGRNLTGIYFAMDFLKQQNKCNKNIKEHAVRIDAKDKKVIVIGGGDTGSDCIGTAIRQGAKEVYQLEIMPKPPLERSIQNPWPAYPMILRTSTSQEEGGSRTFSVKTTAFSGIGGKVNKLHGIQIDEHFKEVEGSEFEMACDLVILAMGFLHPEQEGMLRDLGVVLDERGNVKTNVNYQTSEEKIFAAGDMRRGQSLVVWAIAEGRKAARAVDLFLMGETCLK